jgi:MFS family permease
MGIAPSIVVLTVGWIIASVGWNTVVGNITNSQADRLPESQRGQVAGLSGFVTMVGPVFGAVLGGVLSGDPVLLFMVPAVIGLVLVGLFVLLVHEDDSRGRTFDDELSLKVLVSKFVYDPRQHPDFSWNWLGRFLFYIGLTFNTTFTAFFYASRLGGRVADIGGVVALSGGLSVIAVMAGAIGSGFVSDKLRRRKPFVLAAGILFGVGAVVMAFSPTLPLILAGSFVTSIGLGIFSAVDQALLLDVLPERDTDAGRFVAINQLATSIAQVAAPLIAPAFLAIGVAAGGDRNYTLLYLVAAAFTIVGGAVVLKVRSVR